MITDKRYCVNLLAQLWYCWLTCVTIYSPKLTVKDGTHILHNLITCSGQVDSTEFAESVESAENHNFLSSLIQQPKNYP